MNNMNTAPSLLDPEVMQNPFPLYQWAHANSPVIEIPENGLKVVMSYDMCAEAAGRVEEFSNNINAACASARPVDPARLRAAIEFEFDLPYPDGTRMDLVKCAMDSFSNFLQITL